MTKEKINEFTLKISQANKSEIIVILYDMAIQYIDDAMDSCNQNSYDKMRDECCYAGKVISDLIGSLKYDNELSVALRQCYTYIQSQISLAAIKRSNKELELAKRLLLELRGSFAEIAKQDNSRPLMGNTETVYAGLTYGRKASALESLTTEVSRGFKV